jgi:hypothetical protein
MHYYMLSRGLVQVRANMDGYGSHVFRGARGADLVGSEIRNNHIPPLFLNIALIPNILLLAPNIPPVPHPGAIAEPYLEKYGLS